MWILGLVKRVYFFNKSTSWHSSLTSETVVWIRFSGWMFILLFELSFLLAVGHTLSFVPRFFGTPPPPLNKPGFLFPTQLGS